MLCLVSLYMSVKKAYLAELNKGQRKKMRIRKKEIGFQIPSRRKLYKNKF